MNQGKMHNLNSLELSVKKRGARCPFHVMVFCAFLFDKFP